MTDIVLAGLNKRRKEIATEAREANTKLASLLADLDHLDGAIRTYDPSYRPRKLAFDRTKKLSVLRFALGALRQAEAPMTLREVARHVLAAQGGDPQDGAAMNTVIARCRTALVGQRKAGVVRAVAGPGMALRWEVVR